MKKGTKKAFALAAILAIINMAVYIMTWVLVFSNSKADQATKTIIAILMTTFIRTSILNPTNEKAMKWIEKARQGKSTKEIINEAIPQDTH